MLDNQSVHAMKLWSLSSNLHSEIRVRATEEPFIKAIEAAAGTRFEDCGDDFSTYTGGSDEFIYIRTGGTEGMFKRVHEGKPARLITSGRSNSLAASMEILSYLRQKGISGDILHGSPEEIAQAIRRPVHMGSSRLIRNFESYGPLLSGKRYGVIGKPSDWLISSGTDYKKVYDRLGAELIDIPISELTTAIESSSRDIPAGLKAMNLPKYGRPISERDFGLSAGIYWALKGIIAKYRLDGFTLRCFDLLTSVGNTGCLALSLLNTEGVIATCEGDIPAMMSMAAGKAIFGVDGFQANLSRIEGDRMLFAHCTVPISAVADYCYDTHFESGIGVGIHGEFPAPSKAILFKLAPKCREFICEEVEIEANQYEDNLCRTQVWIKSTGDLRDYMLGSPLGNHHIIFCNPRSL